MLSRRTGGRIRWKVRVIPSSSTLWDFEKGSSGGVLLRFWKIYVISTMLFHWNLLTAKKMPIGVEVDQSYIRRFHREKRNGRNVPGPTQFGK